MEESLPDLGDHTLAQERERRQLGQLVEPVSEGRIEPLGYHDLRQRPSARASGISGAARLHYAQSKATPEGDTPCR